MHLSTNPNTEQFNTQNNSESSASQTNIMNLPSLFGIQTNQKPPEFINDVTEDFGFASWSELTTSVLRTLSIICKGSSFDTLLKEVKNEWGVY